VAEQATGTVEGTGTAGALEHGSAHLEHNPGRPVSWVGTSVVIVGFIVGGIAMVPPRTGWSSGWALASRSSAASYLRSLKL